MHLIDWNDFINQFVISFCSLEMVLCIVLYAIAVVSCLFMKKTESPLQTSQLYNGAVYSNTCAVLIEKKIPEFNFAKTASGELCRDEKFI